MYEDHFGFRRPPFSATPDARCFFAPTRLQQTVDELMLRLAAGQGICVVTGAAGMGKTLLCRILAEELSARFHVVNLSTPGSLNRKGLLQSLLADLNPTALVLDELRLRRAVIAALRDSIRQDRPCVVLVDEVHLLSPRTLEELRALTVHDESGTPLLRMMLAGQPKFEESLTSADYDALNQQIVCHKLLESFSLTESVEYVLDRVARAGGDPERQFTIPALDLIVQASAGNPRLLNRLCDLSLILTCAQGLKQVDLREVEQALAELKQLPLRWNEECLSAHEPLRPPETGLADIDLEADLRENVNESLSPPHEIDPETSPVFAPRNSSQPSANSGQDPTAPPESIGEAFETIRDPYAALDPQRPRLLRTYDDQTLAADWNNRSRGSNLFPQNPPEPPSNLTFDSLPTQEPGVKQAVAGGATQAENHLRSRKDDPAPLLTRRTAEGQLRSGSYPTSEQEFDVVEPESASEPAAAFRTGTQHQPVGFSEQAQVTPDLRSPAQRHDSRVAAVHSQHVPPQPIADRSAGMGRLFSTLRRKLGRPPSR